MTILYFTASGNNYYLAKKIGDNIKSIPQIIKNKQYNISDDKVGIIFPVYGLCIPPYIRKFIKEIKLESDYIFAIASYGFYQGAVATQLVELSKECDFKFSYINTIRMVEDYIPSYKMEKESEYSEEKIESAIDFIKSDVDNNKLFIHENSWFSKYMTNAHMKSYKYDEGYGFTKRYHITDECKSCKICAEVCPKDNITFVEGKPVFSDKCISCFACTQNCPQNAIRLEGEKSTARFRNSHVTLDDMIESNR